MSRGAGGFLFLLMLVLGIVFLAKYFQDVAVKPTPILYSQFVKDVEDGKVKSVTITDHEILVTFTDPKKGKFSTYAPSDPE